MPDTRVVARVRRELGERMSLAEGRELLELEVLKVFKRPFSTVRILECRSSHENSYLVMKTINDHPINLAITESSNQAMVEYDILKFLYPKYKDICECYVPRPVFVVPDMGTYLMEYVDGTVLIDSFRHVRMLSSQRKFQQLNRGVYLCGRWLRALHQFTGIKKMGVESLDGIVDRGIQRLKLIEEESESWRLREFRKTAQDFLEQQMTQLAGVEIPVSGRHGDFSPNNVIAGSRGITVIDFMGYQHDPISVDICKMLVFLEDASSSMTSSAQRVRYLSRSFIDGYGDLPCVPKPAVLLCEAVQRIVSVWGGISHAKRRLHHRLESRKRIARHIQWFKNEEARASIWPYVPE